MTRKPREILMPFVDDMVLAIMAGRKTNTRRELKLRQFQRSTTPGYDWQFRDSRGLWQDFRNADFLASKYVPLRVGDRIGVRESARLLLARHRDGIAYGGDIACIEYRCDNARRAAIELPKRLKAMTVGHCFPNGIFREGVRTWLEVTGVRIERLNEISDADAIAEGIEHLSSFGAFASVGWKYYNKGDGFISPRNSLWESIYGEGSFDGRWVIVTEFKVVA